MEFPNVLGNLVFLLGGGMKNKIIFFTFIFHPTNTRKNTVP